MRASTEAFMEAATPFIGTGSLGAHQTADPDAELRRLGKLWKKAVKELEKAERLLAAAEEAYDEPPVPEGAYCGPRDFQLFVHINHYWTAASDGRNWYGGEGAREFFRSRSECVEPNDSMPEFTALVRRRAKEILAALNAMDLERQRRKESSGFVSAEKRYDGALEAKGDLEGQILSFQARTRAGIEVQAGLIAYDTDAGIDASEAALHLILGYAK